MTVLAQALTLINALGDVSDSHHNANIGGLSGLLANSFRTRAKKPFRTGRLTAATYAGTRVVGET